MYKVIVCQCIASIPTRIVSHVALCHIFGICTVLVYCDDNNCLDLVSEVDWACTVDFSCVWMWCVL